MLTTRSLISRVSILNLEGIERSLAQGVRTSESRDARRLGVARGGGPALGPGSANQHGGSAVKAGKRILAAGGLVLAAAFASAALAQDFGPFENTDPFDLVQGVAVASTEDLAGASGQVTQAIFVPGVGFAITTTAQGTCTQSEGDDCRATTTSTVSVVGSGNGDVSVGSSITTSTGNVVGSGNGDVAVSSFDTTADISATNIPSSQFDTGTSNLGGAVNLPFVTAPILSAPNVTAPILSAPNVTAPILTAPNL